jgi:phosphoribosylanthranilate isomerase
MTPTAPPSRPNLADDRLSDPSLGTRVKVCGIVDRPEIDLLSARAVDFVGLWWGVPGGPHDLDRTQWRALADAAAATGGVTPVLVTFAKDPEQLRETLEGSLVRWIQLHGYPTPGTIRKIKAIGLGGDPIRVIKVLHVKGGECVEASLIGSYEKAGVDVFLFDVVSDEGRVGSTGQAIDPAVVAPLADKLTRPFLLAGGISATNRGDYESLAAHPRFLGIDVDTNARTADGKISPENVEAISRAWKDRAAKVSDQDG